MVRVLLVKALGGFFTDGEIFNFVRDPKYLFERSGELQKLQERLKFLSPRYVDVAVCLRGVVAAGPTHAAASRDSREKSRETSGVTVGCLSHTVASRVCSRLCR